MKNHFFLPLIVCSFLSSLLYGQDWEKIGWSGGNTNSLIRLGSSLLCATEYDGVYRSTDEGESWTVLNTGLPISISSRTSVYLVHSDNYAYFLTGDSALTRALYRLHTNGSSWQKLVIPAEDDEKPFRLVPTGGDTILAMMDGDLSFDGHTMSVYLSPDGGTTWQNVSASLPTFLYNANAAASKYGVGLFTESFDTATFDFVPSGVFYSSDRGLTWSTAGSGLPDSSSITDMGSSDDVLLAGVEVTTNQTARFDGIYRSLDGGKTWQKSMDGVDSAANSYVFTFFKLDSVLFACMEVNTYKSTNHGADWIEVLTDYNDIALFEAVSTTNGILVCTGGGLGIADDELTTSTLLTKSMNGIIADASWIHYAIDESLFGMSIYGVLGNYMMRSEDNGGDWIYRNISPMAISQCEWVYANEKYYMGAANISTSEPMLFVSVDPNTDLTAFPTLAVDGYIRSLDVSGDTIVTGTSALDASRGYIHLSTDDGVNWKNITPSTLSSNSEIELVKIFDGKFYVTNANGKLYASSTAGKTWYSTFTGLASSFTVKSIFAHKGALYIAGNIDLGFDGDEPALFMTTNSGLSWTQIQSNLSPSQYISQVKSVDNVLYLTTSPNFSLFNHSDYSQLLVSHDDGQTWKQLGSRLPDGSNFVVGSNYVFAFGACGAYRIPRSLASVNEETASTSNTIQFASVYPNPVYSELTIVYSLGLAQPIAITVYNLLGQEIETVENEWSDKGNHTITINTNNWASGSYYVRLSTPSGEIKTVKVIKE
jgi:photosystem II stability/assembly factor-like uncharacterized protein